MPGPMVILARISSPVIRDTRADYTRQTCECARTPLLLSPRRYPRAQSPFPVDGHPCARPERTHDGKAERSLATRANRERGRSHDDHHETRRRGVVARSLIRAKGRIGFRPFASTHIASPCSRIAAVVVVVSHQEQQERMCDALDTGEYGSGV